MTFLVGDIVALGPPGKTKFDVGEANIGMVIALRPDEHIRVITSLSAEWWPNYMVRRLIAATLKED